MSDRSADEELSCCTIARVPRLAHKEVCQFGPAFLQLALENEVPLGIDEAKIELQPSLRGDLASALTSTRSRKMKRIGLDQRYRSAVWCRQKRAGLCQHCSAGCVRTPLFGPQIRSSITASRIESGWPTPFRSTNSTRCCSTRVWLRASTMIQRGKFTGQKLRVWRWASACNVATITASNVRAVFTAKKCCGSSSVGGS